VAEIAAVCIETEAFNYLNFPIGGLQVQRFLNSIIKCIKVDITKYSECSVGSMRQEEVTD